MQAGCCIVLASAGAANGSSTCMPETQRRNLVLMARRHLQALQAVALGCGQRGRHAGQQRGQHLAQVRAREVRAAAADVCQQPVRALLHRLVALLRKGLGFRVYTLLYRLICSCARDWSSGDARFCTAWSRRSANQQARTLFKAQQLLSQPAHGQQRTRSQTPATTQLKSFSVFFRQSCEPAAQAGRRGRGCPRRARPGRGPARAPAPGTCSAARRAFSGASI